MLQPGYQPCPDALYTHTGVPSQLLPRRLREPLLYLVLKTLLETQAGLYGPGHREPGAGIQDRKMTQIPIVKQQPARASSVQHSTPWASRPQVSLLESPTLTLTLKGKSRHSLYELVTLWSPPKYSHPVDRVLGYSDQSRSDILDPSPSITRANSTRAPLLNFTDLPGPLLLSPLTIWLPYSSLNRQAGVYPRAFVHPLILSHDASGQVSAS